MAGRTPHDLALFVYGRLEDLRSRPSVEVLDELFQTLFLTSLKSEEGAQITCSVVYVDPRSPDPDPPRNIRDSRWEYSDLADPVAYDVTQLAKIALATDPSCSSLAVHPDRYGRLKIWGIFDQQGGFQSLLCHESESGFGPPGVIQAQILGLGHIIVTKGFSVVAELNGGNLVEDAVDVLEAPVVWKKLRWGFENRLRGIKERAEEAGHTLDREWTLHAMGIWINIIRRVLLRARAFQHGGAFLLTDSDVAGQLRIKYKFHYGRIPLLFENQIGAEIAHTESEQFLIDECEKDQNSIDPVAYLNGAVGKNDCDDAKEGMTGAVALVASLSRVDGLVLMGTDLVVHGFGCEIVARGDDRCRVFHASNAGNRGGKALPILLDRFGTRHRSMARYCSEDESAVGFVVSSDGPVRAFTRSGKRLCFWDNVQLGLSLPLREE